VRNETHPGCRDSRVRWALPCYLIGQGVSLLGDEAYYVALAWAATLAGGAAGVALVTSIAAVPRAVLMLPGGAIADRLGLRRVMIGSDAVRMVIVAVAGLLALGGVKLWVLAGTALAFGTADAFFMPSAAALPPRLVSASELQRANGLITFVRRAALLIGAPLGGFLVVRLGAGAAFLFEAGTFAVSVCCLSILPLRPLPTGTGHASGRPGQRTLVRGFVEGPRAVWRSPLLRTLVLVSTLTELGFTGPYNAGLPLLARHRGWGAGGMGLLLSAFGLGAALGALAATVVRRRIRPGHLIIAGGAIQGAALAALALVPGLPTALALSLVIGVCASLYGTTVNTLIQFDADPSSLVRVMSVVNLSSYGVTPVANAVTGTTAALVSVPGAYLVGAVLEGTAAAAGLLSRPLRTAALPTLSRADRHVQRDEHAQTDNAPSVSEPLTADAGRTESIKANQ
jgi:MFS family permease